MKIAVHNLVAGLLATTVLLASAAMAEDRSYIEGTVWTVSFIKLKPGMLDQYMRDVGPVRKRFMDEARKQGLVLSYKVLSGLSANRDDWDVMVLVEYKNWAALDGLSAKLEAIAAALMGNEEKRTEVMLKRTEVREIIGDKIMQELLFR
jgi:hypothetical protein